MEVISKSTALSSLVSMNWLVMKMMDRTNDVMKDTVNANKWYFYHDALLLMTSKECTRWMQNTKYNGKYIFD